ncbi:MAG: hypothetical protein IJI53_01600 [Clostridia bacterium]|nr:hypothetical protein [Clostridia bacterium]MBR0406710.1 hypothetical protein [Clostridia bacterium]
MNQNRENELSVETEEPKKNLAQSAKEFMTGVFNPLKGKDLSQLVEDFTSEMTLVAEGLSEDQQKLFQETDKLSAQQTELEQRLLDGLHDAEVENKDLRKEVQSLTARLDKAEKLISEKKLKKSDGIASILRQATWLVAIFSAAWVIVTIIRAFT